MFSIANIKRRLSDQGGFSLAEVVMAVFLFTSAVVGVSGLVLSGGSAITRGASDATAANLANKKIEQVRSLPFYKAWEDKNQDIDDFYYNMSVENSQQMDNPGKIEGYGSIPGASTYKRKTAIQYQVVGGSGMAPAVMATNWVPKPELGDLLPGQIDRPTTINGAAIHSMIIEVAVYYRTNGQERVYRQRTLSGDMIIPGGSSVPVLLVTAIDPISARKTESNLTMKVSVSTQESILGQNFEVRLWTSGSPDLVGTGTTVVNQHEIDTHFNLTVTGAKLGLYNISVRWVKNGWVDKSFRNCFTVLGTTPTITTIGNYNWGYRGQNSRQVTINGTNLANPTYVGLLGPNEGGSGYPATDPDSVSCPGSIVSATSTKIVVNFNLTKVPEDCLKTKWTVAVATAGGSVASNSSNRLLVNPPPQVTSVACTPATLYRKVSYSNAVVVTGKYFQSGVPPTVTLSRTGTNPSCTNITSPYATGGAVTESDFVGTTQFTMGILDLRLADTNDPNRPIQTGLIHAQAEVGNWNLRVTNADGLQNAETETETNLVPVAHAPITITGVTSVCYNDWDVPVTITGNYFQSGNMTARFYDDYGLTGSATVTGNYGTSQALDGFVMNTVGLLNTTYSGSQGITATDTENDQTSPAFSYTVTEPAADAVTALPAGTTAPTGCDWLSTAGQANAFWNRSDVPRDNDVPGHDTDSSVTESNICYDNGTYTYKIIAKKMRNLNVRWSFTPSGGSEVTFATTIAVARANKYVLATGGVTWPKFTPDITTVSVKCSNNSGSTYGALSADRIRVKKHI